MGDREKLQDPTQYFPDVPGWAVPMMVSQGKQEVKTEGIERSLRSLWAREREKPCDEHSETLGRIDERLKDLEKEQDRKRTTVGQQQAIEGALLTILHKYPKLAGSTIICSILTILLAIWRSGVIS